MYQKYQPIKTNSMENTEAKNNPYYSRTDTTNSIFPMKNGKNSCSGFYAIAREAATERALPENTMILMN
jgi:peptide-methionine (R)-S-oxide reductase